MGNKRPILRGELAIRAALRTGCVVYFGATPERSIAISTDQAFEAIEAGAECDVWTFGPEFTETPTGTSRAARVLAERVASPVEPSKSATPRKR